MISKKQQIPDMDLLLIRHAESARVGSPGISSDEERTLTPTGRFKTQRAALALNALGVRLNAILASAYPRAVETAQILAENLIHTPQVRPCDALLPNAPQQRLLDEIRRAFELRSVALCGHEPDLSRLASIFLGGDNAEPTLLFHTGAIAYLKLHSHSEPLAGSLHWFLNSHQLELISYAKPPCDF